MIYLDSSVLLEHYLGGARQEEARAVLARREPKVASWLLMVEVPVALRRLLSRKRHAKALGRALARFDQDVEAISLVDSLTDVAIRVRSDARFAHCRSLDAVHACTALLLREWTGRTVEMATFDRRLQELARELDLPEVLKG